MSKIPVNQTSPEHRNYLLAKSYLEYIQWQLADLDSFSSFAPIAERAAKFNQLQERLIDIDEALHNAHQLREFINEAFLEAYDLLIEHTINFYKHINNQVNNCLKKTDESENIDPEDREFFKACLKKWNLYKTYLPADHYETGFLEAAIYSTRAFLEGFIDESSYKIGKELSMQSMDEYEKIYLSITKNTYLVEEYASLKILNKDTTDDQNDFNRFLAMHLFSIAWSYRESHLSVKIFDGLIVDADHLNEEDIDLMIQFYETITTDYQQVAAGKTQISMIIIKKIFDIAGCELREVDLFYPPQNPEEISESKEFKYLKDLL